MAGKSKAAGLKPDLASIVGVFMAMTGIVGGLILEGGSIRDISQVTAGLIVLGGTAGAVVVGTPLHVLTGASRRFLQIFFQPPADREAAIEEIINYATRARKSGVVSLEEDAAGIADPFLRKALNLAVDGTDPQEIRNMMELEISIRENRAEAEARVFEAAGGYAPTVGIIGAVMGLIQVMKHLENIDEVGHGIAVAFVATIYGVGAANLLFLPAANKIKARAHDETELRELTLEGVVSIVEGLNPKLIRSKLDAYLPSAPASKSKKQGTVSRRAPAEESAL